MSKNPLWKALNRQSNKKNKQQQNLKLLSPRNNHSPIDQVFNDIPAYNSNKKNEIKQQIKDDYDPDTKLFIQQLQMAVEDVEDMDISCMEQKDQSIKQEFVECSSSILPGVLQLKNDVLHPELDHWDIQSPTHPSRSVNEHNSRHSGSSHLKLIEKLSVSVRQLQQQYNQIKDQIQNLLVSFNIWMEQMLSNSSVTEMKNIFDSVMKQSLKKSSHSFKSRLKAQARQQMRTLQHQIEKLQEEVLTTALDRTNFQQQYRKAKQQNQQLLEQIFTLQQQVSQKDIYVQEKINQLIQQRKIKLYDHMAQSGLQDTITRQQQLNYERRIMEYEEEIQKLSNLVDQLGKTYKWEVQEKEENLKKERNQLEEEILRLDQREEELRLRQEQMQALVTHIEQSRQVLQSQNQRIEQKKQQVKQMDFFLKSKMQEMETLQKQLNQGYLQLDLIIKQQQQMQNQNQKLKKSYPYEKTQRNTMKINIIPKLDKQDHLPVQSQYFGTKQQQNKLINQHLQRNKQRLANIHQKMSQSTQQINNKLNKLSIVNSNKVSSASQNYNKEQSDIHLKAIERDLQYVKNKLHGEAFTKQHQTVNNKKSMFIKSSQDMYQGYNGEEGYYNMRMNNLLAPRHIGSEGGQYDYMGMIEEEYDRPLNNIVFSKSIANVTPTYPIKSQTPVLSSSNDYNYNRNLINYTKSQINFGIDPPSSRKEINAQALQHRNNRSKSNSPPSYLNRNSPQRTTRIKTQSQYPATGLVKTNIVKRRLSPSPHLPPTFNFRDPKNYKTNTTVQQRGQEHAQITLKTIQKATSKNKFQSNAQHVINDNRLKQMGSKIDQLRKEIRGEINAAKY